MHLKPMVFQEVLKKDGEITGTLASEAEN